MDRTAPSARQHIVLSTQGRIAPSAQGRIAHSTQHAGQESTQQAGQHPAVTPYGALHMGSPLTLYFMFAGFLVSGVRESTLVTCAVMSVGPRTGHESLALDAAPLCESCLGCRMQSVSVISIVAADWSGAGLPGSGLSSSPRCARILSRRGDVRRFLYQDRAARIQRPHILMC